MRNSNRQIRNCIAGVVAILLSLPIEQMGAAVPQQETPSPATQVAPTQQQSVTSAEQQQNEPAKPVGTAAAPYEKTTGVAASRPAGAVIAPAKQRRVRTFLIRMGVVIGAAAAIGTVAALSHASPSRPH